MMLTTIQTRLGICLFLFSLVIPVFGAEISYWNFNEGGGNVATDSVGEFDGTLMGSSNYYSDAPPVVGGGSSIYNPNDNISHVRVSDVNTTLGSLAFWINSDYDVTNTSYDTARVLMQFNGTGTSGATVLSMGKCTSANSGLPMMLLRNGSDPNSWSMLQNVTIPKFTWKHVAFIWNQNLLQYDLYLDGINQGVNWVTRTGSPVYHHCRQFHVGPLSIGGYYNQSNNWPGLIDEVHLYDHSISASELAALIPGKTVYNLTVSSSVAEANTITPAAGTHSYVSGNTVTLNAADIIKCPKKFVFDHWVIDGVVITTSSANVIMDKNVVATAYFNDTRVCGDECHPVPVNDLSSPPDCMVNFEDVAILADNWLSCTQPGCI
ncbi:MAG: LamG-like jellyroll fold domain-containing protein [Phycisphaerales bacterium]